jgi:hypothetical protein
VHHICAGRMYYIVLYCIILYNIVLYNIKSIGIYTYRESMLNISTLYKYEAIHSTYMWL